jgi:PPOX class probable F420-dependent enzyme
VEATEARRLFATAPVARLASVDADGAPHLVPICFALDGDTLYTAVDRKPKRTTRLRRLANVAADPRVSVLADRYEDDWSALWWVRGDGTARIVTAGAEEHAHVVALLTARYGQYEDEPPEGPAIVVSILRWSGWRMTPA